jgi:hypothetical protein
MLHNGAESPIFQRDDCDRVRCFGKFNSQLFQFEMLHLVFANLKTLLIGVHHGVSRQHLQAYLSEFTFRFNRRFYPFNALRSLLGIAGDVEAPTYAALYSGEWKHPTCCRSGQ